MQNMLHFLFLSDNLSFTKPNTALVGKKATHRIFVYKSNDIFCIYLLFSLQVCIFLCFSGIGEFFPDTYFHVLVSMMHGIIIVSLNRGLGNCDKVASDLVLGGGFRQVLLFPSPLTTG